jgi:hypothetical protein
MFVYALRLVDVAPFGYLLLGDALPENKLSHSATLKNGIKRKIVSVYP